MIKDLRELFKGCIDVHESEKGLLPLRFRKERLLKYEQCPVKPYARCPVGVRIDFITDEQEISFSYFVRKLFYEPIVFDIYENGCFTEAVKGQPNSTKGQVNYRRRKVEPSRITIYLPATAELELSDFHVGRACKIDTSNKKLILVLGDSISQGLFGTFPSISWVPIVARHFDYEFLNLSVGGDRFDPDWLDEGICQPNLIIVALGTNDYSFEKDDKVIHKLVCEYFTKLESIYQNSKIIVVTPPWITDMLDKGKETEFERYCMLRSFIAKEAANRGYNVIDGFSLIPHMQEFFADIAHPNDLGFSQYAINIITQISNI